MKSNELIIQFCAEREEKIITIVNAIFYNSLSWWIHASFSDIYSLEFHTKFWIFSITANLNEKNVDVLLSLELRIIIIILWYEILCNLPKTIYIFLFLFLFALLSYFGCEWNLMIIIKSDLLKVHKFVWHLNCTL